MVNTKFSSVTLFWKISNILVYLEYSMRQIYPSLQKQCLRKINPAIAEINAENF